MSVESRAAETILSQIRGARGVIAIEIPESQANVAVMALEKQVPKMVNEIHIDEYYCPSCGSENNCNDGKVEDLYCPKCGQRLFNKTDI